MQRSIGALRTWTLTLCFAIALFADRSAMAEEDGQSTVFVSCRIFPDSGKPAIDDGVLVIRAGRIVAVGDAGSVQLPPSAERIDCSGGSLLPGFWNSHVHFMGSQWEGADQLAAERLTRQVQAMLSRYGVAHAIDTGSDLTNTLAIKRRIDSGEIPGPSIITAGAPFVGPNGTPFYVPDARFPELGDAAQARAAAAETIRGGAGAIKLMTVSLTHERPFPSISLEAIRAVADEAHRAGLKVLVHPTDRKGVELALDGGADVLVHTAPIGGAWDDALAVRLARSGMALIPTLQLWGYEAAKANDPGMAQHFAEVSQQQVAAFRAAGGRILFGTDVGYMTDFDPTEEYVQMAAAGMSAGDILAALTSNPVALFGAPERQGRLAAGLDADLVLLAGNPEEDVRAFADVRGTWRAGQRIYPAVPAPKP